MSGIATAIPEITLRRRTKIAIATLADRRAFFGRAYDEAWPSLAVIASKGGLKLPADLAAAVALVGSSKGTHVVLRGAVTTPFLDSGRATIKRAPANNRWQQRARLRLISIMGACQHFPLHEKHLPMRKNIVHCPGPESEDYYYSSHRLPTDPSTIAPERPFGPSVFFEEDKMMDIGPPCPDIVAFICLELKNEVKHGGGKWFELDEIRRRVLERGGKKVLEILASDRFRVKSDANLSDNAFGFQKLDPINIIGARREYIRYDHGRTDAQFSTDGEASNALAILQQVLSEMDANATPLDLRPGDIWLVNNRRVLTKWDLYAQYEKYLGLQSNHHYKLEDGDRVIIRMTFYSPIHRK